jgi:hypothetical protein
MASSASAFLFDDLFTVTDDGQSREDRKKPFERGGLPFFLPSLSLCPTFLFLLSQSLASGLAQKTMKWTLSSMCVVVCSEN